MTDNVRRNTIASALDREPRHHPAGAGLGGARVPPVPVTETQQPGGQFTSVENGVYNILVWRGKGAFGGYEIESLNFGATSG